MELTVIDVPGVRPATVGRGPTLSAVLCTHERPDQLARALRSLLQQEVPPDEILVIDNAPRGQATWQVVMESCTWDVTSGRSGPAALPPIRYEVEPVQGLDFARNRALRVARCEIVAYLDDDAVAHPEWVRVTRRTFGKDPHLAVCMGRVEALPPLSPGGRIFEANGGFARGHEPIRLPEDAGRKPLIAWSIGVGSGCCMALRRATALELEGFDEALDMGAALPGGGDLDMIWRVLESGGKVRYEPRVRALHEHRTDPEAAVSQIANHNRGLVAMLVKALGRATGRRRLEILAFLGWRLVKPGIRVGRRALGKDPLPQRALLRIGWSCWAGLGAYAAATREATRRRSAAEDPAAGGSGEGVARGSALARGSGMASGPGGGTMHGSEQPGGDERREIGGTGEPAVDGIHG